MNKATAAFIGILFFLVNIAEIKAQSTYQIDIRSRPVFRQEQGVVIPDTFTLDFNIYQNRGTTSERRIRNLRIHDQISFQLTERIGNNLQPSPEFIPGSLESLAPAGGEAYIPDDITVSLLIDRSGSIKPQEMMQIRNAVEAFVNVLPEGSLFLSYFHNNISRSYQITRANFEAAADTLLTRTPYHTDLYNATITKLLEFDSLSIIPNQSIDERYGYSRTYEIAGRGTQNNYLIVLTDGENDTGRGFSRPNPKYHPGEPGIKAFTEQEVYEYIEDFRDRVVLYTLGFGAESADFNEVILRNMVDASGNPDGYIYVEPDKILNLLRTELPDLLRPDYRATFKNPAGKTYMGESRYLEIKMTDPEAGIEAPASIQYGFGSITNQVNVGFEEPIRDTILWGILIGLIIILLVLIILQLIWPLINNKLFDLRYLKRYVPGVGEARKVCPYCRDIIYENDPVVAKCNHIVHQQCWVSNNHMCPEYGQNCSIGKQYYFDISDPFSKKNKIFYLSWVLYGLIGGFFAWIAYMFLKDWTFFGQVASWLAETIQPDQASDWMQYLQKIAPLLAIGAFMGFFLSLLFAYAEEYRSFSLPVLLQMLLRGILGAALGFVSFFIGCVILVVMSISYTDPLSDWLPWLFFGAILGVSLSIKTTIHWKHGLMGGIISIIFSFVVLYTIAGNLGFHAILISFMVYGAGLGGAIATVRSSAEQFFLRILNGPKEGLSIAIHKWIKSQGEQSEVYIGYSNTCEVQMNWDNSPEIAEKHAKIFLNQNKTMPVIVSLEKGKSTFYDQRVEMQVGREYDLQNGTTFLIGETIFQYFETSNPS